MCQDDEGIGGEAGEEDADGAVGVDLEVEVLAGGGCQVGGGDLLGYSVEEGHILALFLKDEVEVEVACRVVGEMNCNRAGLLGAALQLAEGRQQISAYQVVVRNGLLHALSVNTELELEVP